MTCSLVVNSRDKFVKILNGRLIKGGYAAVMAENCGEAFELLEWMFFHLAVLDFSPSEEDDLLMEFARELRASDPMLPIIALPLSPEDPRCAILADLRIHVIFSPVQLPEVLKLAEDILTPDPDYDPNE